MDTSTQPTSTHIGRKISRLRELRGIKQETLANELGVSQQSVSRIEQSEFLEDDLLEKVAKILGVPADSIKNFSEEAVFNYFNTFNDSSSGFNYHCTFNPIEKIVKLYDEKIELLERLLLAEKQINELMKAK